jgi:hypothetical protein
MTVDRRTASSQYRTRSVRMEKENLVAYIEYMLLIFLHKNIYSMKAAFECAIGSGRNSPTSGLSFFDRRKVPHRNALAALFVDLLV